MALKPTIFKFDVSLSDIDRNCYETLNLTVAQHPSETVERMMVRVLAYCLQAEEGLEFTRGLSDNDEPDLWRHSLDGRLLEWIEVGEPSADRLRKASRQSGRVQVYSFNTKSDVWWRQIASEIAPLAVEVYRFPWPTIQKLGSLVQRTGELSVTINRPSVFVAGDLGEVDITLEQLSDGKGAQQNP